MKIPQVNFLIAMFDQNNYPNFMDWADALEIEVTQVTPSAVRLKDVMKTVHPGMDPNTIIPMYRVYARAHMKDWEDLRKSWQDYVNECQERDRPNKGGLIQIPEGTNHIRANVLDFKPKE